MERRFEFAHLNAIVRCLAVPRLWRSTIAADLRARWKRKGIYKARERVRIDRRVWLRLQKRPPAAQQEAVGRTPCKSRGCRARPMCYQSGGCEPAAFYKLSSRKEQSGTWHQAYRASSRNYFTLPLRLTLTLPLFAP